MMYSSKTPQPSPTTTPLRLHLQQQNDIQQIQINLHQAFHGLLYTINWGISITMATTLSDEICTHNIHNSKNSK